MTPSFELATSRRYERLARQLLKRQPKFYAVQERAFEILSTDPTNRSGFHNIKKLTDVPRGEGQWRLAFGRFRIRYDLNDQSVVLQYCGLRREDTY